MGNKIRILLAEDDDAVLKMTKQRLEYAGFDVIAVVDGEQALAQVQAAGGAIQLILLDIFMPKLDGLEVCRRLKASPATERIPVILFTASTAFSKPLVNKCIELGVADWLKKPFRSEELLGKIRQALGPEGQLYGWPEPLK